MWEWCAKCPRLPVARKCCFCVPVRIGVILFGYVNLVVWLLMFPMLVYMLAERVTSDEGGGEGGGGGANCLRGLGVVWLLMFPMLVYMLAERVTSDEGGGEGSGGGAKGRLQLPLTTACVLLDTVMTVVLLIGAHQKRRLLLTTYVWGGASVQLMMLALDMVFFDDRHPLLNAVFLPFLGLNLYLLYLVWSLSVRLRARDAAPAPLLPHAPAAPHRSREWRYVMNAPVAHTAHDAVDTAPAH